ncbi:hypothetical protein [Nesterenkonia flava]|uniref:ATP synthase protein I n=1 Tax=Nesterenkonia flava TaxID=469799 RepID=A0ABU1FS84_9MICC|nr:hypothetical protein [Nesterenkonia flava]MDR5711473.1 hypothetical protein [Nesterenkonia flava]
MGGRRNAPEHGAWWRLLKVAFVCSTATLLVLTAAAWAAGGSEAAISALVGGGLVIALYVPSIWAVDVAERTVPDLAIPLYMLLFVLKFIGVGLFLTVIAVPAWLSLAWGGSAAVAVLVVWQAASIYVFSRMRLRIVPAQDQ